jgi:hypothetical protein
MIRSWSQNTARSVQHHVGVATIECRSGLLLSEVLEEIGNLASVDFNELLYHYYEGRGPVGSRLLRPHCDLALSLVFCVLLCLTAFWFISTRPIGNSLRMKRFDDVERKILYIKWIEEVFWPQEGGPWLTEVRGTKSLPSCPTEPISGRLLIHQTTTIYYTANKSKEKSRKRSLFAVSLTQYIYQDGESKARG